MISSELVLIDLFLVNVFDPRATSFAFDLLIHNYLVPRVINLTLGVVVQLRCYGDISFHSYLSLFRFNCYAAIK